MCSIPSSRLVRKATKSDQSAPEIAQDLATEFGLKPEERRNCIRQLRLVRMGARSVTQQICKKWQWFGNTNRQEFLQWLEGLVDHTDAHSSESDDE